ncbi:MAG: polyprenol monophosphomannose synthase [Cyclobacteriaceae bacterium]|nr:polyprenol monophosphomannose synthase [Cyclobacteriaceae bacterium]
MSDSLVIIPTYNEKENIDLMIKTVFSLPVDFDILIIDDNSPDGTAAIVKGIQQSLKEKPSSKQLHLLSRKGKLGLGTAYIEGFKFGMEKGYAYIIEMDADFSHDPNDLVKLKDACAIEGNDMAIGSRYVTGVNVVNWPLTRVLISYFASYYVRKITGMKYRDTTAGFVCYRRKVLETINLNKVKFVGYAFQIEMKFLTYKHGFKIKEVPIIFTDRVRGQSKMSTGIIKEALFGVLQMKIGSWFKKYPQA